jgi:nitrogen fixation protein NifU and related proteins
VAGGGFDDLYQALILDHYRKPRNRGELPGADRSAELLNPLCGDEIAVEIKLDGARISDVRFHGHGCSISQASASMMTELIKGKDVSTATDLVKTFKGMMLGQGDPEALGEKIGDLVALHGVTQFPARIKCATLGWNALMLAIEGKSGKQTITGE